MSRALLVRRLNELEAAGVITKEALDGKRGHSYRLTPAGEEFKAIVEGLGKWGQRWT
jgi:DNA-binding HxlR family transcriptional regulator